MLAKGAGSELMPAEPSCSSPQISSLVSSEKSALTAPARVPVATRGLETLVDQANAAVRGISCKRPIIGDIAWRAFKADLKW